MTNPEVLISSGLFLLVAFIAVLIYKHEIAVINAIKSGVKRGDIYGYAEDGEDAE